MDGRIRKKSPKRILKQTNDDERKHSKSSSKEIKPNLFLDIDQTLIAAVPFEPDEDDDEDDDETYDFRKFKEKAKQFDFENMDSVYIIFERPHLQTFLDYVFREYNVSLFTAASKSYCLFILENIIAPDDKPERKLDYTFFSYHCSLSSKFKGSTKDLSILWDIYKDDKYSPDNTLIIDDYDNVYNAQPKNAIPAPPFHFTKKGSEKDTFLLDLIPKLKKIKENINNGKKDFLKV
jgi:TFIIF-interacting CTD phosphatase-like protein